MVRRLPNRPLYPDPRSCLDIPDPDDPDDYRASSYILPLSPVHTNHRRQDLTEHFRVNALVVFWKPEADGTAAFDLRNVVFARIAELFTAINPASHTILAAGYNGQATAGTIDARLIARWTVHDDPPRLCPSLCTETKLVSVSCVHKFFHGSDLLSMAARWCRTASSRT